MQGLIGEIHAIHSGRPQLREAFGADLLQEYRQVRILRSATDITRIFSHVVTGFNSMGERNKRNMSWIDLHSAKISAFARWGY